MTPRTYNVAISCGVLLASTGAGLIYMPAGLITAGVLVLSLTIAGARLAATPPR